MREKFSHKKRSDKRRQYEIEPEKGKWVLGWDYILLIFPVVIGSFFMTTMFKELSQDVINVVMFQLFMLVLGITLGFAVTRGNIDVYMPSSQSYVIKTLTWVIGGFVLSTLAMQGAMGSSFEIYLSSFEIDMFFALSAAIVEEALYSFFITIGVWKIISRLVGAMKLPFAKNISITISSLVVGYLFALGHYFAYAGNESILLGIFMSRFIFAVAFLHTRNIIVPALIHLLNNGTIVVMLMMRRGIDMGSIGNAGIVILLAVIIFIILVRRK